MRSHAPTEYMSQTASIDERGWWVSFSLASWMRAVAFYPERRSTAHSSLMAKVVSSHRVDAVCPWVVREGAAES